MYEKNRFGQFFIYLGIALWMGYLMFFAVFFAFTLNGESVEPYHLINGVLILFLIMDFCLRIPFQKTPSQEIKPYLLLPIPRRKLIDMLLIRSGLSGFNFFWLSFFVPFAILTVARFYGVTGVLTYSLGIWMLMLANNYLFLLCRTLIAGHKAWLALPVGLYGGWLAAMLIPEESPLLTLFVDLGEGFITGQLLTFAGCGAVIAALWYTNHRILQKTLYNEINKVEDTTVQVKSVSEYRFLDRYGQLGEYIRLELKLLLRNKICRNQLYMVLGCTSMFSLILGFTDTYTGLGKDFFIIYNFQLMAVMFLSTLMSLYMVLGCTSMFSLILGFTDTYTGLGKDFFIIYNFQLMAVMFLSTLMSYEGNYIDALLIRRESIYTLLRAKYLFYSAAQLIPFLLLTPGMVKGSISLPLCLGWLFFTPGPIYCLLFQMAVYNSKTIDLNTKMMSGKNVGSGMQNFVSGASFIVPFVFYFLATLLVGETYAPWQLMAIGLVFILASPWWLKQVYRRFMKRRYQNLEGFHQSRQK